MIAGIFRFISLKRCKAIPLFFLAVTLFQYAVTGIFFVQRGILHLEKWERSTNEFAAEEIVTLSVCLSELDWVEEGREFIYHDRFYDVFEYTVKGDQAEILCHADEDEDKLHEHFVKAFLGGARGKGRHHRGTIVLHWLRQLFVIDTANEAVFYAEPRSVYPPFSEKLTLQFFPLSPERPPSLLI